VSTRCRRSEIQFGWWFHFCLFDWSKIMNRSEILM